MCHINHDEVDDLGTFNVLFQQMNQVYKFFLDVFRQGERAKEYNLQWQTIDQYFSLQSLIRILQPLTCLFTGKK